MSKHFSSDSELNQREINQNEQTNTMANQPEGFNFEQRHGKQRVRVGRVWKNKEGRHFFVEWNVNISLLSDCVNAYLHDDNSDIVATDTMKNTVHFSSLLHFLYYPFGFFFFKKKKNLFLLL